MDVDQTAVEMLEECVRTGQAARRVGTNAAGEDIRHELRQLARTQQVRIRTALMNDVVVVARTDAALWSDDTATMRSKLTPR